MVLLVILGVPLSDIKLSGGTYFMTYVIQRGAGQSRAIAWWR
jgi:hypothetical protein